MSQMEQSDIEKIRKILRYRGRSDLAELLQFSVSNVRISSNYGSRLFSLLSTFEIYSPIRNHEGLRALSESDQRAILDAVLDVYPVKDYEPEIKDIQFFVNLDLEPEHKTILCNGLKELGSQYIEEQIAKCEEKIQNQDFDGAITNARTLIESVCLFVLEESAIEYNRDGDLPKLFKKVYNALKMDPALYPEDGIKQTLSGIISVINGLSNLRNEMGDAHGRSKTKYYKPTDRHAILAVNAAKSVSEFLYASWKSKKLA